MPDSKLDLKNAGSLRLMELDTSTLFVPYGRPISEYLLGIVGNQNGAKALLSRTAMDFSPAIRWKDSTSPRLRTTGFGEQELDGLTESAAPAGEPPDPAVADFLPFEWPDLVTRDANESAISPAMAPENLPVSLPRNAALPLRPRMTFGPAPEAKVKPAAVTPRPVAPPPAAKSTPAPAPPQKPAAVAPKPAAPAPPSKPATPVQTKPGPAVSPRATVTPISGPKPAAAPVAPIVAPTPKPAPAPAARSEAAPTQPKPSHTPARAPVSSPRTQESAISTLDAPKPAEPPVPSGRSSLVKVVKETPPAVKEAPPAAIPKPQAEAPMPKPPANANEGPGFNHEPHLTLGADAESRSFLEKVPFPAKIGIAIILVLGALYFVVGKSDNSTGARGVMVGEQGWSTEWASDATGSRRGRQITLYRPSTGMADYQMQFSGQIESKALGWVFRAVDTKNYYAMKIETLRPGAMALTHFAVVEGRESSNAQRPLSIDARPGAVYRVKLDVNGPRFTISIGGEPVDFWTDNRLKTGAVGFMNERDERGATSSVQFSFPQGLK